MVQGRDDVVGIDSCVILAREVWQASGHVETFSAGTFWSTNKEISWIAAGITLIGLALKLSGNLRASTIRANATVESGRASAEVTRG